MRKSVTREIDGTTYTIKQVDPMTAVADVGRLLAKALGPAFAKAAAGVLASVGEAAGLLFERLSADEIRTLVTKLLRGEGCTALWEGKTLPLDGLFDHLFEGKPFSVVKLLAFAIEVNYQDFSDGLRTLLAGMPRPAATPAAG